MKVSFLHSRIRGDERNPAHVVEIPTRVFQTAVHEWRVPRNLSRNRRLPGVFIP